MKEDKRGGVGGMGERRSVVGVADCGRRATKQNDDREAGGVVEYKVHTNTFGGRKGKRTASTMPVTIVQEPPETMEL